MNKKVIALGTFILGISVLAYSWFYYQGKKLANFTVKMSRAVINKISFNNINFDLYVFFKNNSDLDVRINGYDLGVYINGKHILNSISKDSQLIKNNHSSEIKLSVQFNPKDVLKGIASGDVLGGILTDYSKLTIQVKGKIDISDNTILSLKDLPVDFSMTLKDLMSSSESK